MRDRPIIARGRLRSASAKPFRWVCRRFHVHHPRLSFWDNISILHLLDRLGRFPLFLNLYYAAKGTFSLEQRVTFCGKIMYHQALLAEEGNPVYFLRRNLHRLEKALSTPARRASFGESYILQTVCALRKLMTHHSRTSSLGREGPIESTIQWGIDALTAYFRVVEESPTVAKARAIFLDLTAAYREEPPPIVHFVAERPTLCVNYDDLLSLARRRHSIRRYAPIPIPSRLLDKAFDVARHAPSACNRQAYFFTVCQDPALVLRLATLAGGANDFANNIPCLVVVVGQLRAYFKDRDVHLAYIDASLAVMAFIYALETLGLASCCINWPNEAKAELEASELLGLSRDERVLLLVAVGYPAQDGLFCAAPKKLLTEIRRYVGQ